MTSRATASDRRLDVLFALEGLLPCPGGAERFALELLSVLGRRHRVRALVLGEPDLVTPLAALAPDVEMIAAAPPSNGHDARLRRRVRRSHHMRELVREVLDAGPADVVVGQLNAGAGALAGAREAGTPSVMLLAGYEALCIYAFSPGSRCRPASGCRACPYALALPASERRALVEMRAAQDAALASAACLVAPSAAVSTACVRACGRRALVAPPVTRAPAPIDARPDGAVVLVSSVWSVAKGVELLAPIVRRLPGRPVVVAAPNGVPDPHRLDLAGLSNVTVLESACGIETLLDDAAMLLVPSQHPEPFGRVAFEAMAAGVPVLASATGGLREFVPAQQLIADFADADAWAAAVQNLGRRRPWSAARRRGAVAAARVLACDTPARIERWLRDAAAIEAIT